MNSRSTFPGWLTTISMVFLLGPGYVNTLAAAELINLDTNYKKGIYTVRLEMELDVTAGHVKQVLTDYHQLHLLNPSIVESRLLSFSDYGYARVFTRVKSCVLFYCREFTRVEDVYQSASGDLVALIVPEQSDFKAGQAVWRITEYGNRTLLVYEASMQPDFFIPPVIGSYLVEEKVKDELLVSFNRIECCASSKVHSSESKSATGSVDIKHRETC